VRLDYSTPDRRMPRSRSLTGPVTLAVLIAAAGGGWYLWRARRDDQPEYYTATVDRGDIVQTVTATGTIKPLLDVLVSSQISGYVTAWYADFNTKVKKGQLLATLLPKNYEAAVMSAEGDLASAKANYDLQEVTLKRDRELLTQHLIAQSDYDSQAALVEEAEAQIQIKQAALETAKTNLSYCRIVSPLNGIVISRNIDVGNSVAASLSAPTLFEIANDLTQMQIDAAVSEADIGNVRDGEAVDFTVDAYPNRTFHGTVYQVRNAPQTQQNVVIYDVMIKVDNRDLKLKPGMTANTSIIVTRRRGVVRVPNSALRFRLPPGIPAVAPAAGSGPPAPAGALNPEERRRALREILQQAGYSFRSGPPAPAVLRKIRELAEARGIQLPERLLGRGRGEGEGGGSAPVFRTVYLLPGGNPAAPPEELRIRVGITDGVNTEALSGGLKPGDVLITGMNEPSSEGQRPNGAFFGRRGRF
jgi:HlyD family secretion protein